MDPSILTKILAAGAMGVSIFCIWKVYDLLQKEQEKAEPRPLIIRTIYGAMGFAVVMTLLSLGIEIVRHNMDLEKSENPKMADALRQIARGNFYSLDSIGKPEPIALSLGDTSLVLGSALPTDFFAGHQLMIKKLEDRYLVQREKEGRITTAGHLLPEQINGVNGSSSHPSSGSGHPLKGEDLLNLGLSYTPPVIINELNIPPARDEALAVNYLIQLLGEDFQSQPNLQKKAVRLLTQPRLMQQLQQEQYGSLIAALESNRIRQAPYNSYELAQVFHSRAFQTWNKENKQQDLTRYTDNLRDYVDYYEAKTWIQDQEVYPTEAIWYKYAKGQLK